MKKLVFLAAAVAAIASCAKVETVSMPGQQEIAFKAINAPTTKAAFPNATTLDSSIPLGVSAVWNKTDLSKVEYFNNVEFAHNGTSWAGGQYWPKTGTLDFAVYAPYNAGITVSTTTDTYKTIIRYDLTDATGDIDFVYGDKIYKAQTNTGAIPVLLKHARSQIIVNVKNNAGVPEDLYKVDDITFTKITTTGIPVVTYAEAEHTAALTFERFGTADQNLKEEFTLNNLVKSEPNQIFTHYIMPNGNQDTMILNYSVKTAAGYVKAEPITYTLSSSTSWESAKRYIFNITFTADEILMAPEVENWTDAPATELQVPAV